jgi:hypothetical protein
MRIHYGPWQPCWISNQHQKHKSGRGPSSEHFWQVWLISVQRFQRGRFKCEKLTDGRTTDAYPWQKLTWPKARWAKKWDVKYHVNTSSVSAMLNHLQLPTLEHHRNLNRITMLYKITNNLIAVDPKLYLTPQPSLSTRNNNPLQYQIISTRTNYYKYSFFPHAVVLWNSLPYTVVNAGSLDQFKQLIQGQNI